jgi:hypothetical protein
MSISLEKLIDISKTYDMKSQRDDNLMTCLRNLENNVAVTYSLKIMRAVLSN